MEELDRQYSPSQWCVRMDVSKVVDAHIDVLRSGTERVKKEWPKDLLECDVPYYETNYPNATVDIYHASTARYDCDKVLLYIHGGYWSALHKNSSGWFADQLGMTFLALNYDLCPNVSLSTIVDQVRRSIVWIRRRFPQATIILCGHSAGAHLSAMAMLTNWKEVGLNQNPIAKIYMISGIYDLDPIRKSCVNEPLQLTEQQVIENSPMTILKDGSSKGCDNVECYVIVGQYDSPEFQRQSKEFAALLESQSIAVESWTVNSVDHFDIVENLSNSDYELTKHLVKNC